jgi:type I restriction enzyme M protein
LNENGRAAVVIDAGAASRGSGSQGENKEKSIRRWFIDQDLVECAVILPDNLFYNTPAAGMLILLNRKKRSERQVMMVNASCEFRKGRPKNELTQDGIKKVVDCFRAWRDHEGLCRVVETDEIVKADYNLSPPRYVRSATVSEIGDVQTILDHLTGLANDAAVIDARLSNVFAKLGYQWGAK